MFGRGDLFHGIACLFGSIVSERGVPKSVFSFRMMWIVEGSVLVFCSEFLPHKTEVVGGSLVDAACDGGGAYGSNIMQSGAGAITV